MIKNIFIVEGLPGIGPKTSHKLLVNSKNILGVIEDITKRSFEYY